MLAFLMGVSKIISYGIVFGSIQLVTLESVLLEMYALWNTSSWHEVFSTLKKSHKHQSTVKQRCDLSEIQGFQKKLYHINMYLHSDV